MPIEHWFLLWSALGLTQIFPVRKIGQYRYRFCFKLEITEPLHIIRYILAGPFVWFIVIGCAAAVALGWMENHPDED